MAPETVPQEALRELQRAAAAAMRGDGSTGAMLRAPAPGVTPRWHVYRQGYAARLVDALRDNFEVLARALGDAGFDRLGRAYVEAQPSRRPSIRWFGHRLADFMRERSAAGDADLVPHPALADLAAMDWALRDAFDAADAEPLTHAELAALPGEQWSTLRLQAHPSVRIVELAWAVEAAWQLLRAFDPQGDMPEPELPPPTPNNHRLLVWRIDGQTRWRSLEAGEAALLRSAFAGHDFATLCERGAALADAAAPCDAARIAGLLAGWIAEGLIARASCEPSGPELASPL